VSEVGAWEDRWANEAKPDATEDPRRGARKQTVEELTGSGAMLWLDTGGLMVGKNVSVVSEAEAEAEAQRAATEAAARASSKGREVSGMEPSDESPRTEE
jgi:hypothetical protein